MNEILIVLIVCVIVWVTFRLHRNRCDVCGTRYFLIRARKKCEQHHRDTAWMMRKFAEGEYRRMNAKTGQMPPYRNPSRTSTGMQRAFNDDGPVPFVHNDYSYVRTERKIW